MPDRENQKQIIAWGDISDSASDIFNIWVDLPEIKWAEKAWADLLSSSLVILEKSRPSSGRTVRRLPLLTWAAASRFFPPDLVYLSGIISWT